MNNVRIFLRVFVMSIFFSALQSGIGTVQGIDTEGDMNMSGVLEQDSHIAITERNAEVVAKVNLPGFDKKDINVRVK